MTSALVRLLGRTAAFAVRRQQPLAFSGLQLSQPRLSPRPLALIELRPFSASSSDRNSGGPGNLPSDDTELNFAKQSSVSNLVKMTFGELKERWRTTRQKSKADISLIRTTSQKNDEVVYHLMTMENLELFHRKNGRQFKYIEKIPAAAAEDRASESTGGLAERLKFKHVIVTAGSSSHDVETAAAKAKKWLEKDNVLVTVQIVKKKKKAGIDVEKLKQEIESFILDEKSPSTENSSHKIHSANLIIKTS